MDFNVSAPPVNNALLPDIYNRLDAELIERTRVVNTQLDKRLSMQEKVLNKYRRSAEVVHNKEALKVRNELMKIRHSLPTVGFAHNINAGVRSNRKLYGKRRGIPITEKDDNPFCERHFIHFLPNKRKYYKVDIPDVPPTPPKSPPASLSHITNEVNNVAVSFKVSETNREAPSSMNGESSEMYHNTEHINEHINENANSVDFSKRALPGIKRTVTVSKRDVKGGRHHSSPSIF